MSLLADLEQRLGRPLAEWSGDQLRDAVTALAGGLDRTVDELAESQVQLQVRRVRGRNWWRLVEAAAESAARNSAPARKRGRKQKYDVSDDYLLEWVRLGKEELGWQTDVQALSNYVSWYLKAHGRHVAGNRPKQMLENLQKRLSYARRRIPK
jgi:ribosomal protein S18